jgi:hypothetical protein
VNSVNIETSGGAGPYDALLWVQREGRKP